MATIEFTVKAGEPPDLSDVIPAIYPGYEWEWAIAKLDDNKDPEDTTGWTCEIVLKDVANGETKATLTTSDYITNTPAEGEFAVAWPYAQTALLDCGQVKFVVALTTDASKKYPAAKATVEVAEVI